MRAIVSCCVARCYAGLRAVLRVVAAGRDVVCRAWVRAPVLRVVTRGCTVLCRA